MTDTKSKGGLRKLAESRKGVVTVLISIGATVLGLLKGVPAESIIQILGALGVAHSVGQGIADHGKK